MAFDNGHFQVVFHGHLFVFGDCSLHYYFQEMYQYYSLEPMIIKIQGSMSEEFLIKHSLILRRTLSLVKTLVYDSTNILRILLH